MVCCVTVVVQVALNTGHHQLPLYASGPNGVDPLTPTTMKDAGSRRVPCASLLVRLYQAPVGRNGQPLEVRVLPQNCPLLQLHINESYAVFFITIV